MKEVTNESETKKILMAHSHPAFLSLLAGNLPESQKSHGGDSLL